VSRKDERKTQSPSLVAGKYPFYVINANKPLTLVLKFFSYKTLFNTQT
jgi:hypothetical protein